MSTYYREIKTLRVSKHGKRFVAYKSWEDFGRETAYAHSWGAQEKRSEGTIWVWPDEDIYGAVARRRAQYAD